MLLQLSLLGGYRFGGPTDLLVATGGLTGDTTMRRLGETQKWGVAVSEHDAMRREGEGFQLTVHVRLMHALVNHRFEGGDRWDTATVGACRSTSPIRRRPLDCSTVRSCLAYGRSGVRVTRADSRAVMHLWKYVGWLIGVNDDWLFDTEREQHAFNYHVLLAQGRHHRGRPTARQRHPRRPGPPAFRAFPRDIGRAYTRARLLSMLRLFLGKQGMRDLELPVDCRGRRSR